MKKKLVVVFVVVSMVQGVVGCQSSGRSLPSTGPEQVSGGEVSPQEVVDPRPEAELPDPLPEVEPTPPISPAEMQTPLRRGQPAPYAGILFSPEAVARIEVEFRTLRQQFQLDLEVQRREGEARRVRDVATLELRLRTTEGEHRILLQGRDREIERLRAELREALDSGDPNPVIGALLAVGGVVVGVLVGFFVGILSN